MSAIATLAIVALGTTLMFIGGVGLWEVVRGAGKPWYQEYVRRRPLGMAVRGMAKNALRMFVLVFPITFILGAAAIGMVALAS